jgi:hypothetical protein
MIRFFNKYGRGRYSYASIVPVQNCMLVSYFLFCLDTKKKQKKSRIKECLRPFIRPSLHDHSAIIDSVINLLHRVKNFLFC